jgi:hypothetical protein
MRQGLGRSAIIATMSAATVLLFAGISQAAGTTAAAEPHCQSFAYQQDAQAEWEKWGPNDPWRWDSDGDGVVCESKPKRPDTPVSSEPGAAASAAAVAAEPSGAPPAPPAPPQPAETPWDGTHHWAPEDQGWEDEPRPVGGVQAGGGGLAGDDGSGGVPVLPLAGVAAGALLLTAGTTKRRRRQA